MAEDKILWQWASDQLMSLVGYSEVVTVKYVIRIAKEAASPADVLSKLVEYGFTSSTGLQSFAKEISSKVPHKHSGLSNYEKREKEAAMLVNKLRSYGLLDADDEVESPSVDKEKK